MDYSLLIAVSLYFLVAAFGWALTWLNLKHLEASGAGIPSGFEGHLDAGLLERIRDYTAEQARFGLFESVFGSVLAAVLIGSGLWIIKASPGLWWLWLWGFFFAFSLFMMYLSPYVIEPLFNRFDEVDDPDLKERIRKVLAKAGITVAKVQKVDASRRSSHTNAYFTGIGSVKRIVLYDTLMERLDRDELVSVLAHETGHWKGKHLFKGMALMEALALVVLYAAHRLLESGLLESIFNMPGASFFAQAVMLGFLGTIAAFPFTPFFAWFSRRHEREADRSAIEFGGDPEAYSRALVKLSKDNLSNLHPHPLYAAFYYSHPPVVERVAEIRKM